MKRPNPFKLLASSLADAALDKVSHALLPLFRTENKKHRAGEKKPTVVHRSPSSAASETAAVAEPPKPSVIAQTVQLFLSFSHLDGYVSPFLKLDCVRQREDADAVAKVLNEAMCIMRYICQSDIAFCEGALERMVDLVEAHDDMEITFTDAWINGCNAAKSSEFLAHFKSNSHESWQHQYVVTIPGNAGFDEFIAQIQALYYTKGYACTEIGRGMAHDGIDHENWLAACAEQMKDAEHKLVSMGKYSSNTMCLTLLKPLELNVLRGMLSEFGAENVDQVVEVAGRIEAQPK